MRDYVVLLTLPLMFLCNVFVAFGQEAATFEELRMLVKPGDTVAVTGLAGDVKKGKIVQLTATSLRLSAKNGDQEFRQENILRITQKKQDSLSDGAWMGGLAGGVLGLGLGALGCAVEGCEVLPVFVLFFGAAGAGTGVGVDALLVHEKTIFRPRRTVSQRRFNVTPLVSGENRGLVVRFSF